MKGDATTKAAMKAVPSEVWPYYFQASWRTRMSYAGH
jgi:hypothetical protein